MAEDNNITKKTPIDPNQIGSRYSNQSQNQANENQGVASSEDKPAHNPFPGKSSKAAAIKTYKDYAAESLREGGGSLTKMIIAEREKKREKQRKSAANPKNVAMTFFSIIFIFLGLAVAAGAFILVRSVQNDPRGNEVLRPEPFILFDYRSEAYLPDPTKTKINRLVQEEIENTSTEIGSIKYLFFSTDNQYGGKTLMTTADLLDGLRAKASGTFLRSLDDNFMFGLYSTTDNSPFLMLRTENFDAAYAEILSWEQSIGNDLGGILGKPNYDYSRSGFVDVVYFNRDVRAILDVEGEPVIGYSFIDRGTIVFFANKLTLREVIERSQENTIKR